MNSIRFKLSFKFCRYEFLYDEKVSIFLLCNIVKERKLPVLSAKYNFFVQLDFFNIYIIIELNFELNANI